MRNYVVDISEDGFVRIAEATREEIYAGTGKDFAYYREAGLASTFPVYGFPNDPAFYKRFEFWLRKLTAEDACTTQK